MGTNTRNPNKLEGPRGAVRAEGAIKKGKGTKKAAAKNDKKKLKINDGGTMDDGDDGQIVAKPR